MNIVLFYLIGFVINITTFIFLFNTNLGIEIFFYKGVIISFISLIFQFIFLFFINRFKNYYFNIVHIFLACMSTLCFTLLLHTLILTSIDRAISVFFISLMNEEKIGLTKKEIKDNIYENYFEKDQAIERRIKEQLITKNIIQLDDKYIISKRGEFMFNTFAILSKIFNIKNNFIPKYDFKKNK